MTTTMPAQPSPTAAVNYPRKPLVGTTSTEPVITSYAVAPARTITAEVSPEEAQRLALAQQAGTLSLTLRNLVTTEKPALRSLSVSELSAATVKATGSHYTPTVTVNRAGQRSAVTVRGD